jgi:hypothetical protein
MLVKCVIVQFSFHSLRFFQSLPRPFISAQRLSERNVHSQFFSLSWKLFLLFWSSDQNFLHAFVSSHLCKAPRPYHPLLLNDEYKQKMPRFCQINPFSHQNCTYRTAHRVCVTASIIHQPSKNLQYLL